MPSRTRPAKFRSIVWATTPKAQCARLAGQAGNGRAMPHFLDSRTGPLVCAHRGHSIDGHENSLAALDAARGHGAEVCEIDIWCTPDGEFVVFHDDILDHASTGKGAIGDRAWTHLSKLHHRRRGGDQILEPLRRLSEVFDWAEPASMSLIIELKGWFDANDLGNLIQLTEGHGFLDRVLFSSFEHRLLIAMQAIDPRIRTFGILQGHVVEPVSFSRQSGFSMLALDYPFSALESAAALAAAGIAASHFVDCRELLELTGDSGRRKLERIIAALRNGSLSVLFCDDVTWGREIRSATTVADIMT